MVTMAGVIETICNSTKLYVSVFRITCLHSVFNLEISFLELGLGLVADVPRAKTTDANKVFSELKMFLVTRVECI